MHYDASSFKGTIPENSGRIFKDRYKLWENHDRSRLRILSYVLRPQTAL